METPAIRRLPQQTINLIAAGEVVERPASIVKELVENAIDANASSIEVHITNGGIEELTVLDDGHGIPPEDIPIAVERHATSKLNDDNLSNIQSFGFRGEALASIVAVSNFHIISKVASSQQSWQVSYASGEPKEEGPTKDLFPHGTQITISRLFHNIPARLSFLRSVTNETQAITQTFKSLALAHPRLSFHLTVDGKSRLQLTGYPADVEDTLEARIGDVLGDSFFQNSLSANFQHPSFPLRIRGRISLPTFHHGNANNAILFINQRFVKDRTLVGLLRVAYGDTIPKGQYPSCALFLDLDPLLIDVNAHPSKTEIRLRQPQETRNIFKYAIREILKNAPAATSDTFSQALVNNFKTEENAHSSHAHAHAPSHSYSPSHTSSHSYSPSHTSSHSYSPHENQNRKHTNTSLHSQSKAIHNLNKETISQAMNTPKPEEHQLVEKVGPLGVGRAQVIGNYIIAENDDGLVIVDQHAAHERILYEEIKTEFLEKEHLPSQNVLSPPILSCNSVEVANTISKYQPIFQRFGFVFEPYKEDKIRVMATPMILKQTSTATVLKDIISIFEDFNNLSEDTVEEYLQSRLFEVLAMRACHRAVRGFHPLTSQEIHDLLRKIEQTPLSSQCNHGRPSFITLKRCDLERLFERK